jgi:DNA-binding CsgD family transcriptional regulator
MTELDLQRVHLDELLFALNHLRAKAIAVLGPSPFGRPEDRIVSSVYPPRFAMAAALLCDSTAYGAAWRDSKSPLVAWNNLATSDAPALWRQRWIELGMASMVRLEMPLSRQRSFECFVFCESEIQARAQAAEVVYALLSYWPLLKDGITSLGVQLSVRERESLQAAADGLTAKEAGERMKCTERTVTHHWTRSMDKLQAKNKVQAVQIAANLGLL